MAYRLDGAKPLYEPMYEYCLLNPREQTSVKFNRNSNIFIQENALENVVCEMASILSRSQRVNPVDADASYCREAVWTQYQYRGC